MTSTPEKVKPTEKTPAEIAAELDRKAQVLEVEGKASDAQRKRGVAEKIRGLKTELELGSLQKTLPFHEAKDIEDARGNSTSAHPEVLATAAVGTAGIVAAIDKLDGSMEKTGLGKLGIKESIKEWITEELTEELDKDAGFLDKIIHKIKMMFLVPFAKMFGVDVTKKKGEGKEGNGKDGGVTAEGEKGKIEEAKETGLDALFNASARALVYTYPDKNKYTKEHIDNAPAILSIIKDKSYAQIHTIYSANKNNNTGLVSVLGLKDSDPKTTELAVVSLMQNEGVFASFFKKVGDQKSWKDLPLADLFKSVGMESKHFMKIEALQTEEDVKKMIADMTHPMKGGVMEESMQEKYNSVRERFAGMTPKVVSSIFSLSIGDITDDYINKTFDNDEEKKFLKETLLPFREKFLIMLDKPSVNGGKKIRSYLEGGNSIKMSELLMVFIKTGGHANFEEMNAFEHVSLYQSIFSLLMKRNEEEASGYMTRLLNEGSVHLPPEAKKLLVIMSEKGKELLIKSLASTYHISVGIFENLTAAQKVGVLAAGAIFLLAGRFIFGTKVAIIAAGLAALLGGSVVAAFAQSDQKKNTK